MLQCGELNRVTSDADMVRENKEEAAQWRPLHRHAAGQMSSRPPFTPEPQNGTAKAYSRTALRVKLPQGAASRILLTVAIMSRQRRVRSPRLKEL